MGLKSKPHQISAPIFRLAWDRILSSSCCKPPKNGRVIAGAVVFQRWFPLLGLKGKMCREREGVFVKPEFIFMENGTCSEFSI